MLDQLLSIHPAVRYAAVYRNGELQMRSKAGTSGASSSESDRYEELIVNPTLLRLTQQRGDIDCGGLDYVVIRYGNFFQLVYPTAWGHVSVCIEKEARPLEVAELVGAFLSP